MFLYSCPCCWYWCCCRRSAADCLVLQCTFIVTISLFNFSYCTDSSNTPCMHSFSPKLLPRHVKYETLSICNTPKTLAKAKLEGMKRKSVQESSNQNKTDGASETNIQVSSGKQVEPAGIKENKAKWELVCLFVLCYKLQYFDCSAHQLKCNLETPVQEFVYLLQQICFKRIERPYLESIECKGERRLK